MKITVIYAAMTNYEHGLGAALKIVTNTLTELGEEVSTINLAYSQIPYYDGIKSAAVENIMADIAASNGVIFAASALMNAPCALMKAFLEHLECSEYQNALESKNCLILTTGKNGGERATLEYLSGVIGSLGGFDAVRIAGGSEKALTSGDSGLKEIIERQTEDYYRILRQNRKYIIPKYQFQSPPAAIKQADIFDPPKEAAYMQMPELSDLEHAQLFGERQRYTTNVNELYEKHNLSGISEAQASDISEITQFFAKKYVKTEDGIQAKKIEPIKNDFSKTEPRKKNCRQLTQSLPHYYNPQLAAGLAAVMQINISGTEAFEGYLTINGTECEYSDGIASNSDIVILSDAKIWTEILKGKFTAQKAFMIGQLKVRGNFLLLTKFDQLFNQVN